MTVKLVIHTSHLMVPRAKFSINSRYDTPISKNINTKGMKGKIFCLRQ